MRIMILGASYGSLLSTKLLMAGHDVTLICLPEEADLINKEGTYVRIKLRDEAEHRTFHSGDAPGKLDAMTPADAKPGDYDFIALAMQEPQYTAEPVKNLLAAIAAAKKPCISIMNMPPLPYLLRIPSLADIDLAPCYNDASVWAPFDPDNVTLCSPDPQAFRPPEEKLNVLHVGLPTNFKAAEFADAATNAALRQLADDIDGLRTDDGKDIPVKLRVHESLFIPMAKWSMLLCGNYRCILDDGIRSIKDTVHGDLEKSRGIYEWVSGLVMKLGGAAEDAVPFEKYANAAESLLKPSSAARAIDAGAPRIERVDRVVQTIGKSMGMENADVDAVVKIVDARLAKNNA